MKTAGIAIALCALANAQSFDVASIRVNKSGSTGPEGYAKESVTLNPGTVVMRNVTLSSCIKWAFDVREYQIIGAPAWMTSETYDISARAPTETSTADMRRMLQSLFAQRFHLVAHRERRELSLYELVVAKEGARFSPATGEGPATMLPQDGSLVFRKYSMEEFAAALARRPVRVDRPVIDKTSLNGRYDFTLKLADNMDELKSTLEGMDSGRGDSILLYIERQLGLKLESRKGPVDVVVIERIDKTPTEN